MCTPKAKPDPRLAGFVAPPRSIVNPFKSEVVRYKDGETNTQWIARDKADKEAWEANSANAGKTRPELARLRGGAGMNKTEAFASYLKRQKDERTAFDASELGQANESSAAYAARLKIAQQEYINRNAAGAAGAAGAPSVASTDKMANRLKQKSAQRVSRASAGRSALRIGA